MNKKFILSCMAIGILAGGICNNVSASQKGKMDPFHLQIVAGHMKTKDDLLNLTQLSRNKEFIVDRMRINPYSIKPKDLKLFSHIDTLRLETIDDVKAFLQYKPDEEYEKFPQGSNLRDNRGKFAKIEVTAKISYFLAQKYLKVLKTLLRGWDDEKNREKLVANKVKFFNVTWAPANKIGYIENGEFKFNDNVYDGDDNNVRNENKTYFLKSIGLFSNNVDLKSIKIPNSVTIIECGAFGGCTELTEVMIPNSVVSIDQGAFEGCTKLKSVEIPDGVRYINNDAFKGCTGLTSITIPDSVCYINDTAFANCSNKLEFHVPSQCLKNHLVNNLRINENQITVDVKRSANAWIWPDNGNIEVPNDLTELLDHMFSGRNDIESITIPNSVQSIGEYAFFGCRGLTSVTIPDSVKSIGRDAFAWCRGLTSITIPDSVTEIGHDAFFECHSVKFYVTSAKMATKLFNEPGMFFEPNIKFRIFVNTQNADPDNMWKLSNNGHVDVPERITCIDNGMFASRFDIKSITLNNTIQEIGDSAFSGCEGLESIVIPNSVTKIGWGAFCVCTGLKFVTILDGVKEIGEDAFRRCTGLKSVVIPNSVKKIDKCAFWRCTGLTSITIHDSVTEIGDNAFLGCQNLNKVFVYSDRVKQLVINSESEIDPDIIEVIKKPEEK